MDCVHILLYITACTIIIGVYPLSADIKCPLIHQYCEAFPCTVDRRQGFCANSLIILNTCWCRVRSTYDYLTFNDKRTSLAPPSQEPIRRKNKRMSKTARINA